MMPAPSVIASAFSKLAPERVTLPLQAVASGQELSRLFIEHPLDICLPAEPLGAAAKPQFDELVAAAREFREMADLYHEVELRVAIHRLQKRLDTLAALGISMARGVRSVELELEAPPGQQRWRTSVLYLLAFRGACPGDLET
jgi:hypothetical protein